VTDNLPEYLSDFDLSREEGTQSILTLINLIPDPAVIYHREKDEIITANNPLFLLTSLGESDFVGKPIKNLLPNLSDTDPISGHNKQALLRHKKQPLIPVNVRIFSLTHRNEIILFVLKPASREPGKSSTAADQTELIHQLNTLIQNRSGQNFTVLLQQILSQAASLLDAEIACIYKASGSKPQLIQYATNLKMDSNDLPNLLTSEELANSQMPFLWKMENPPVTYLQRTAASADYKFLVTVPLGQDTAKFGLFVAGGKIPDQNPNTLALAQLITSYLSGFLEDQIAVNNLTNLTNKVKQVVKIQNEIISNLEEGVLILSPDLTIAEINPAAETILGYSNAEVLRQHVDSILIGSESLGSVFSSAQQGLPSMTSSELTLHRRNGKSFPAQVMVIPVINNDRLLSVIALIQDMSEEEQSLAARKQLEQRAILGEVTAIFAHEVRNPINAIMLSLQVMEDNLEEDHANRKWIENIRDECNKLLYLMDSVLSFAKPLEYKMSSVNLDEMLSKIIDRWQPRLLRLNIESYYESEVVNPLVEGDQRALDQVFTNLISNSVNAMSDQGGSLGIKISESELEEDRKFYEITLTDSGHGIPDEIKAHLFKPFVTGSARGTGLGLAITQRIINAHKGRLEVDSFTGGTIFKIYLAKFKGSTN